MRSHVILCALAFLTLGGCAASPATKPDPRDPWERVNRATYTFNDKVDRAIAKPAARAYRKVVPRIARKGVSNFFSNLEQPTVMLNDLLQGKWRPAGNDAARFLLNTTLGLGGLFDPASPAGLDRNDEDFGQTLGKWGVRPGPYLMLPFLGPATVRDGVGDVVDQFTEPDTYVKDDKVLWSAKVLGLLEQRERLLDLEPALERTFDKYAFIRNAYLQRRAYLVSDGAVAEEPPPAEDEFSEAELEEAERESGMSEDEPPPKPEEPRFE
jgi:phospholipid-binding lipoprotein MlaA